MNTLNKSITTKAPDYLMMCGAGVIKYGEERLLSSIPAVGNGTLKSAAIKAVCGIAAKELIGGFWGNSAALGFTTDAVEDVLFALMGSNPAQVGGSGSSIFGTTVNNNTSILEGAI